MSAILKAKELGPSSRLLLPLLLPLQWQGLHVAVAVLKPDEHAVDTLS